MSYFRLLCLWGRVDSNHRTLPRTDLQSVAIAAMRLPHCSSNIVFEVCEPMEGFEPPTPRLQITCSGQLSYIGIYSFFQTTHLLVSRCKDTTFFLLHKLFFYFYWNVFYNILVYKTIYLKKYFLFSFNSTYFSSKNLHFTYQILDFSPHFCFFCPIFK